jgi:hypothetical protein
VSFVFLPASKNSECLRSLRAAQSLSARLFSRAACTNTAAPAAPHSSASALHPIGRAARQHACAHSQARGAFSPPLTVSLASCPLYPLLPLIPSPYYLTIAPLSRCARCAALCLSRVGVCGLTVSRYTSLLLRLPAAFAACSSCARRCQYSAPSMAASSTSASRGGGGGAADAAGGGGEAGGGGMSSRGAGGGEAGGGGTSSRGGGGSSSAGGGGGEAGGGGTSDAGAGGSSLASSPDSPRQSPAGGASAPAGGAGASTGSSATVAGSTASALERDTRARLAGLEEDAAAASGSAAVGAAAASAAAAERRVERGGMMSDGGRRPSFAPCGREAERCARPQSNCACSHGVARAKSRLGAAP